ncbi:FecR family protein [Gaoshiqia sp. Z1-71]|uniref:FecR family protein n=1 Tax=Gaoshiqia hydrogeniformans TaxID=3290090 RepID=UPI003BF7897E
MTDRNHFNELLADEEFQNGLIHFDLLDEASRKALIKRYSVGKKEFIKARTLIGGLSFKETRFSEEELNYLWERLGIGTSANLPRPKLHTRTIINWVSRIAAILFIPLFITSLWFFNKTQQLTSFKNEEIDRLAGIYNTVSAPLGGRTKAVLPDGSEVWLNSGSSVQYPIVGDPAYREVKLSGEGFFRVIKDPEKPMLVTVSGMQVKVYGTTFNLRAYDDDPDVEAALVEGEISIVKLNGKGNQSDTEYRMKPGEMGRLDRGKDMLTVTRADHMDVFTGWVNGKYVFRNKPFKGILNRLERLHNVEFVLEDRTLEEYNFNATFEDQNIDRIMEIFAVSLPITWRSVKAEKNNDTTFSTRKIIISRDNTRRLQ